MMTKNAWLSQAQRTVLEQAYDQLEDTRPEGGAAYFGKVRDIIDEGDTLLLHASDRISAFDRHLGLIPYKGALLTQLSAWWFKELAHICPHHMLGLEGSRRMRVKKCRV